MSDLVSYSCFLTASIKLLELEASTFLYPFYSSNLIEIKANSTAAIEQCHIEYMSSKKLK